MQDILQVYAFRQQSGTVYLYSVVEDFKNSLDDRQREVFEGEVSENRGTAYNIGIIQKYNDEMPVWVMVEIIPFGRLISFYKFCAERFGDDRMKKMYYCLLACREIRNAAAHSNCILNDLHVSNSVHRVSSNFPLEKDDK